MNNVQKYVQKATDIFKEGYSCSQAVFLAFEDQYEMNRSMALKLSSSFGAGMGQMREVCGAVTGMFMAAGLIFGYDSAQDHEGKAEHYKRIQQLSDEFETEWNTIICRELLGLEKKREEPKPTLRPADYYDTCPCINMVATGAEIFARYLEKNGII